MTTTTERRGFLVYQDRADEISAEGDSWTAAPAPALYDALVAAGFPVCEGDGITEPFIDVAADADGTVVAFTVNPAGERAMGEAGGVFSDWLRALDQQ